MEVDIFSVTSYRGLVVDNVRYTVNDKEVRKPLECDAGQIVQMGFEFPEMIAGIEEGRDPMAQGPKSLVDEMNWSGAWWMKTTRNESFWNIWKNFCGTRQQ